MKGSRDGLHAPSRSLLAFLFFLSLSLSLSLALFLALVCFSVGSATYGLEKEVHLQQHRTRLGFDEGVLGGSGYC